jgi:hypothetical protein
MQLSLLFKERKYSSSSGKGCGTSKDAERKSCANAESAAEDATLIHKLGLRPRRAEELRTLPINGRLLSLESGRTDNARFYVRCGSSYADCMRVRTRGDRYARAWGDRRPGSAICSHRHTDIRASVPAKNRPFNSQCLRVACRRLRVSAAAVRYARRSRSAEALDCVDPECGYVEFRSPRGIS